jgi:hypothetical protein
MMSYSFRSCVLEDTLCNWSYGTCAHANISQMTNDINLCLNKKHISECQCDHGYEIKKVNYSLSED